ncbi:unnamed protein product [Meloidogyne enterolobii]|uniref:Uncharacterized protein n=1 Tax=Meloidogyne enterolobii TaxID=390850 RepID=A0ACB1AEE2_MELEN
MNSGVEYSNIPVYGRKMLNEFEMGKSGGDKVVGKSKGNEQGKGKESKDAKLNKNVQNNADKKSKKLKNKKTREEKFTTDLSVKNPSVAPDGLKEEEKKELNKASEKTKIENNKEEEDEENCEEDEWEDEDEINGFLVFKFLYEYKNPFKFIKKS